MSRAVIGFAGARGMILTASAVAILATLLPQDARAFCRMTTGAPAQVGNQECVEVGEPLAWRRRCLTYAVDERGSAVSPDLTQEELLFAVDSAFSRWAGVTCGGFRVDIEMLPLEASTCQEEQFNQNGGNVNTIAFVDTFDSSASNAFAVTIVWHDTVTGQILDADILINEDLGPYDVCPDSGCPGTNSGPNRGPADLPSIITHEVGHFFGIGHSDVNDATMFPSAMRVDTTKRTLAQDDIDAMCTIYPPGTCTQSCDPFPAPINGLDLNCEDGASAPESNGDVDVCFGGSASAGGCAVGEVRSHQTWLAVLGALVLVRRVRRNG